MRESEQPVPPVRCIGIISPHLYVRWQRPSPRVGVQSPANAKNDMISRARSNTTNVAVLEAVSPNFANRPSRLTGQGYIVETFMCYPPDLSRFLDSRELSSSTKKSKTGR